MRVDKEIVEVKDLRIEFNQSGERSEVVHGIDFELILVINSGSNDQTFALDRDLGGRCSYTSKNTR